MKMKNKAAFSLAELLVSISIIAILTVLFLVNYRQANQRTDIIMTSQIMVTDIRFAQANSLGLIKYDGDVPAGGWGVYFSSAEGENDKYTIFADLNDNKIYDDGEARPDLGGRVIILPRNIIIDEMITNTGSYDRLDVTFLPPDPRTIIFGTSSENLEARIILREAVGDTTKSIVINFAGLIEVID